jgi:toxin ParE1/3/4
MSQFRISDEAKEDMGEIWSYIAREGGSEAADRLVDRISEGFPTLADFPGMGQSRLELAPSMRSFPVGNYLIFYQPIDNGIEVVRVLHGARDLPRIFNP